MKYYVVDAFTDELFHGNPAGVCILDDKLPDETMQKIAFENNLAETAFAIKQKDSYGLRWFTPEVEMDLCGHATLATAYVIMNYYETMDEIHFDTMSGRLTVTREEDGYLMDLPSRQPIATTCDQNLSKALGCRILETYQARDLLVVVENEATVKNLPIDMELLKKMNSDISFTINVTAKGDSCDFVSRFFVPNSKITEDPVTGSAHSTLIPFWSKRLHKTKMLAKQLSPRGGVLRCEDLGDRVHIIGNAVCYMSGEININ